MPRRRAERGETLTAAFLRLADHIVQMDNLDFLARNLRILQFLVRCRTTVLVAIMLPQSILQ